MTVFAPIALVASTGALLALPLAPALRELVSKRDAGPLVTRKDDGRIDNFARSLRARCAAADPQEFISGSSGTWTGPLKVGKLVICSGPIQLPDGFHALDDFYAEGPVSSGKSNMFRALLGEAEITLESNSQILRWIHSESSLEAGVRCSLFGRASAGSSIKLSAGCIFERMHAPAIYTTKTEIGFPIREEAFAFSKLARTGFLRRRIHRFTRLRADEEHYGDVVSTSGLNIDDHTSIFGSVKTNGDLRIGANATVDGSLVSTRSIHIAAGCYVKGPVIAEREIVVERGVQIGLPKLPTTVSAPHIHLASGAVLFGTVWARVEGRVED